MQKEASLRKASALATKLCTQQYKMLTLESVKQYLSQQRKPCLKASEFNPVEPYYFNTE